jgi:hypothetical protein
MIAVKGAETACIDFVIRDGLPGEGGQVNALRLLSKYPGPDPVLPAEPAAGMLLESATTVEGVRLDTGSSVGSVRRPPFRLVPAVLPRSDRSILMLALLSAAAPAG